MDQFQPSGNPYGQPQQYYNPYSSKHSERMAITSLALGMIALLSCTCLYLSIPCGALAIIFATLSRGGEMRYTGKAQIGLILGTSALVLTTIIYIAAFAFALAEYGSIDGILKAYSDMSGIDYNDLIQQLYQTP